LDIKARERLFAKEEERADPRARKKEKKLRGRRHRE
jgi:hypothetical protein